MLNTINVTIDSKNFQITQFPALKAAIIEKKLAGILVPVLAPLVDGVKGSEINSIMESDIDFTKVGKGLTDALMGLSDDDYMSLLKQLFKSTVCTDSKPPVTLDNDAEFDKVFTGSTKTIYKLIYEVLKANNLGFLDLLGGLVTKETGSSAK